MSEFEEKQVTRRGFLSKMGQGFAVVNVAAALLRDAGGAPTARGARSSRAKTGMGGGGAGESCDSSDIARICGMRKIESRSAGERASG